MKKFKNTDEETASKGWRDGYRVSLVIVVVIEEAMKFGHGNVFWRKRVYKKPMAGYNRPDNPLFPCG